MDPAEARVFADRFRDPVGVSAGRQGHLSEHSCSVNCPAAHENPKRDVRTVPIRVLVRCPVTSVVRPSMVSPETANADDYTLETVDATHFVVDEQDLVRKKLIALAEVAEALARRRRTTRTNRDRKTRILRLFAGRAPTIPLPKRPP